MQIVYYIKMNAGWSRTRHNCNKRHRPDHQSQFCRTDIFLKSVNNVGGKLYNKLRIHLKYPENIKLFTKELNFFLLQQTFYSV